LKDFALIGAAGYIASQHFKAIKETNNTLIAALDKFDSVGRMDSYFPEASFFVEFERFDRHLEKLRRAGHPIDYLSVCTPNYLHDSHIRFGLRQGANVICEKPLVLNPWNISSLEQLQKESGKAVYNILQLRLHPSVIALKKMVRDANPDKVFEVDLTYITARGNWYYTSWKGDENKSGGIATNIGIHFFDMLIWIFGSVKENIVHLRTHDRAAGFLKLERATVRWFLSINEKNLPDTLRSEGKRSYRSIKIEDEVIELNEGFDNLHTKSYERILEGQGFTLMEALPSINLTHDIRNKCAIGLKGDYHPFAQQTLSIHPFNQNTQA
jgi:UDP-N-acetyl-2-amino-2-deoxyglucuronate dehydrogenase